MSRVVESIESEDTEPKNQNSEDLRYRGSPGQRLFRGGVYVELVGHDEPVCLAHPLLERKGSQQ